PTLRLRPALHLQERPIRARTRRVLRARALVLVSKFVSAVRDRPVFCASLRRQQQRTLLGSPIWFGSEQSAAARPHGPEPLAARYDRGIHQPSCDAPGSAVLRTASRSIRPGPGRRAPAKN